MIKPPGWRLPVDAVNLPRYYDVADAAKRGAVLFALTRVQEPDNFKALLFTDTQPTTAKEVGYLDQSLVEGLVRHRDYAFGVTLGDVTSDRPDLYPAINAAVARLGTPWFNLNGNHDLNLDGRDDRGSAANWEAVYGPSTYAFRWGKILFVALNDVRYLGGPRYIGGLRPDQFEFLGNLLRLTPADAPVVIMLHIPLFSPDPMNAETFRIADRARLFALLQDRPALVLSGHTHYQRNVFYGPADGWHGAAPLHEYNVAAACGSFWGGPPDARGIPVVHRRRTGRPAWLRGPHLPGDGPEARLRAGRPSAGLPDRPARARDRGAETRLRLVLRQCLQRPRRLDGGGTDRRTAMDRDESDPRVGIPPTPRSTSRRTRPPPRRPAIACPIRRSATTFGGRTCRRICRRAATIWRCGRWILMGRRSRRRRTSAIAPPMR